MDLATAKSILDLFPDDFENFELSKERIEALGYDFSKKIMSKQFEYILLMLSICIICCCDQLDNDQLKKALVICDFFCLGFTKRVANKEANKKVTAADKLDIQYIDSESRFLH
ncbi:hypothetical protein SAMN05660772_02077 [Pasteurella testudinis DSM 23072]|uniref:Uncharacterized protein n=1 Tax=Pasteurella testudinis DSM 23072 TaxID=1122938 RepID=A0A1W1UMJ6_9PAST|nr:hypothetical protein [Pasteurella testudinis]SMB82358.1 hypothetical protein SAMN05660772_02077 [Pasteurella testudinis DSM 23072]SUB52237.1 Uncharacterised protein [Pasteurella testudinis]